MTFQTLEHPADGAPMTLIAAGSFLMGLPATDFLAEEHEKPAREVNLAAFWLDIFPVTNARYGLFINAGGYQRSEWWSEQGWHWRSQAKAEFPLQWQQAGWDGADQPVAGVSWYEAEAYARWCGRRLPTSAEWEKAARGTDFRRYPWGNEWPSPDRANFAMLVGRTTPVGLYRPGVSPYGSFDMAGNVNNWTADWYWPGFGQWCVDHNALANPVLDDLLRLRLGGEEILEKVDRGGGYATPREMQEVLGCTRQVHWPPATRESWNGFRTAMDA